MNLITSTLNDFYHCCKIPVKAISYELNEIYKIDIDKLKSYGDICYSFKRY